jgi:putative membrane protein
MVRNLLITTCFLTLAVCGAIAGQDPSQSGAPATGQAGADSEFVTQAAQSGMAEVSRAEAALQKSSSEDVKRYAQKIIDDHTNANNQLKEMAGKKGITLPTEVGSENQSTLDRLSTLSGPNFDSEYMTVEVKEHEKALNLFQNQARNGSDQELKSWAQTMTPHLETHQQTAHAILAKITAAGTPTTSEQMHEAHHPSEQARAMDPGNDMDDQTARTDPSASEPSHVESDTGQDAQSHSDMSQSRSNTMQDRMDTQTDQTSGRTDQTQRSSDVDLPRSASPMPLVGLLGLLSLGGAAGARLYRTASLRAKR